ncbi:hypothetical protein WICPIJ_005643 [Wickerhamomyces pijperi]|uniref:Uncharacterized protein n=1 Tax=Wickerhamomyces pijperi TaxID=599730 RepID=A0A9P8Q5A0_WICPI|nr:hypothetical protein WICPIJ_005643 [Wickerhamomyces pijperi]
MVFKSTLTWMKDKSSFVTFIEATPAKWKVFKVICVPGSPIDCAPMAPTAVPGSTLARLYFCNEMVRNFNTQARVILQSWSTAASWASEALESKSKSAGFSDGDQMAQIVVTDKGSLQRLQHGVSHVDNLKRFQATVCSGEGHVVGMVPSSDEINRFGVTFHVERIQPITTVGELDNPIRRRSHGVVIAWNRNSGGDNPEKKEFLTNPLDCGVLEFLAKCGKDLSWNPSGTRLPAMICCPTTATICDTFNVDPFDPHVAMINGALEESNSLMQTSPTSSLTLDNSPPILASKRGFVHDTGKNLGSSNNDKPVVRRHFIPPMLLFRSGVCLVLGVQINNDWGFGVRLDQHGENLLTGPHENRLHDRWRRQIELQVGITHHGKQLCERGSVEERILMRDQVGPRDEILRGGNDRLTGFRSQQVVLNPHQVDSLGSGFLCLWHVQVHLVTVEISIVWRTHTLVQSESSPWADLGVVRKDGKSVKRRLSVEKHNVAVFDVSLNDVTVV